MSQTATPNVLELQSLEVELHQSAARASAPRLDALLHADYREFGRSGRQYTKAQILRRLPQESAPKDMRSENFELKVLGPGVALLTYLSWTVTPDGVCERHTLRASIWQQSERGWQMRFHQGTAAEIDTVPGQPTA